LAQLAQASNFATRKGKEGALDLEQSHAHWADKLARTLGVPLASVAPSVWHQAGADAASLVPPELALQRAAQQAVALAQQEKATWTRADLVKYLGRLLPRQGRDPAQATARSGCGRHCAPPNWLAWTPVRCSPKPWPDGTWTESTTSPP
jgi:hypothetical protein